MAVKTVEELLELEQGIVSDLSSLLGEMNTYVEHVRYISSQDCAGSKFLAAKKAIVSDEKENEIIQKIKFLMDTLQDEANNFIYENLDSEIDEGEQNEIATTATKNGRFH